MKRPGIHILPAAALLAWLLATGAAGAEADGLPFPDVSAEDGSYAAVAYVYQKGWMVGTATGEFQPTEPLSRGAFVAILGRVDGVATEGEARTVFRDIPAEEYYEPYVRWAAEENLVSGYTDGRFCPDSQVTRQDMAVILVRYLTHVGVELPTVEEPEPFGDMEQVSDYAQDSVELARTVGLLRAGEDGNFYPQKSATRAEAAEAFAWLGRMLEEYVREDTEEEPEAEAEEEPETYRVTILAANIADDEVVQAAVTVTQEGGLIAQATAPCVLDLYPGEYIVTAAFETAEMVLPVTVRESPRSVILWEPRSDLSMVVKTAEGQAMPGIPVTVSREGQAVASAVTDDQGICHLGTFPLGEYSVTASQFLYEPINQTVSLTQDGDWVWKGFRMAREADPAPSVLARLRELREQFPAGRYWNHRGVEVAPGQETWQITTDQPCNHAPAKKEPWENEYYGVTSDLLLDGEAGIQCFGFASMLSDQIFGADAPIRTFHSFDDLRVGDQIRLTVLGHSMVVIEKDKDYIAVAEANADYRTCKIAWGRVIRKSTLEGYGKNILYMTRYPD